MSSSTETNSDIVVTSKPITYAYQSPEKIREVSWKLAAKIAANLDEFKPTLMVALWRGGAGVGMYMHEYLKRQAGLNVDHTAIRTGSYVAPGEAHSKVRIQSLRYLVKHANPDTHLLIIDDIFDSGSTVESFLIKLKSKMGENMPLKIKVATPYWKPDNNKTQIKPDYYVEIVPGTTWIAFPHEISDFKTDAQLADAMGQSTLDTLLAAKNA